LGSGESNTNSIILNQGGTPTDYAAGLAKAYRGGGYTDWYLPSQNELYILYQNRLAIGGFANASYWSSTESGQLNAISINFQFGNIGGNEKWLPYNVRAIRRF
jgi:hypothetical protein